MHTSSITKGDPIQSTVTPSDSERLKAALQTIENLQRQLDLKEETFRSLRREHDQLQIDLDVTRRRLLKWIQADLQDH